MEDVFFERLETIKTYYGIKNNTEIIRFMINEKYRDIAPSGDVRNINEKIIPSTLRIFKLYRKKGDINIQDIAQILNVSMDRLLMGVVEDKESQRIAKDLLLEE